MLVAVSAPRSHSPSPPVHRYVAQGLGKAVVQQGGCILQAVLGQGKHQEASPAGQGTLPLEGDRTLGCAVLRRAGTGGA